jgi:hypothetical protein
MWWPWSKKKIDEQRQQQLAMLTAARLPEMGLMVGRIRFRGITHNSGWYNGLGQKIGWGDLSGDDFKNIQAKLRPGELFVILPENESYWEFVKHLPDSKMQIDAKEANPGVEYMVEHAYWLITPTTVYHKDYLKNAGERDGMPYQPFVKESFIKLLEGL